MNTTTTIARVAVVLMMLAAMLTPIGASSASIEEDMPGWDCRTMGNHICGLTYAVD